jgi:hypothetical protein
MSRQKSKSPKQEVLAPLAGAFAMEFPGGGLDAARQKAEELGVDPFELLLRFASGKLDGVLTEEEQKRVSPGMRLAAIMEATQYLHPKRRSIDIAPPPPSPEERTASLPAHTRRLRILKLRAVLGQTEDS